jgi:hypothetical protein
MDGWVPWAVGGAVLVLALVAVDRAFAAGWFDGPLARARQRRLERPRAGGAGVDAIGTVVDVLDPSHKHVTDERARERSTTVQVPGEAPPFLDLDAGVATVDGPVPPRPNQSSEPAEPRQLPEP